MTGLGAGLAEPSEPCSCLLKLLVSWASPYALSPMTPPLLHARPKAAAPACG